MYFYLYFGVQQSPPAPTQSTIDSVFVSPKTTTSLGLVIHTPMVLASNFVAD